jgi:CubicO group peptidase (beta-lactamase class C family)
VSRTVRLIIVVLVTLTIGNFICSGDQPEKVATGPADPQELERFLDSYFAEHMGKQHIPGAAFVFVKDAKVFLKKGYGLAHLERKLPVSPDTTIFRIGSISKVFTAEAVVQLADRGSIDLHADVNRYLKGVKVPGTFAEPVTAAHLLSHTAGFDEIRPGTQAPDPGNVLPLSEFLAPRLVRLWRPGRVPMYSTYGITLAGALVEDVSGLRYEDYLAKNIWGPLGMKRTSITVPHALTEDVAAGYEYRDGGHQPQRWEWYHTTPASSINSTAADMAVWMITHLQNGRYGGVRTMSDKAARAMHQTQATGHSKLPGLAYGFEEEVYGDLRLLVHGGNMAGFSALVVLIPEHNAGFFVVNHLEGSNLRDHLKWGLLERYYGPARKAEVPRPPPDFSARAHLFVGRYAWNTYGHTRRGNPPGVILTVGSNPDGTLTLNGRRWVEAEPLLFVREDGASKVAFRTDELGRVTHLFSGGFWVFERLAP